MMQSKQCRTMSFAIYLVSRSGDMTAPSEENKNKGCRSTRQAPLELEGDLSMHCTASLNATYDLSESQPLYQAQCSVWPNESIIAKCTYHLFFKGTCCLFNFARSKIREKICLTEQQCCLVESHISAQTKQTWWSSSMISTKRSLP